MKRISIWKNFRMKDVLGGRDVVGIFVWMYLFGGKMSISFFEGGDDNR